MKSPNWPESATEDWLIALKLANQDKYQKIQSSQVNWPKTINSRKLIVIQLRTSQSNNWMSLKPMQFLPGQMHNNQATLPSVQNWGQGKSQHLSIHKTHCLTISNNDKSVNDESESAYFSFKESGMFCFKVCHLVPHLAAHLALIAKQIFLKEILSNLSQISLCKR